MTAAADNDPFAYKGPLRDINGKPPFNGHWWPVSDEDSHWHRPSQTPWGIDRIIVVPLNNGMWLNSFDGCNLRGRQLPSRDAAVRAAAAGVIRSIRRWLWSNIKTERLRWHPPEVTPDVCDATIAWALSVAGRPTIGQMTTAARRRWRRRLAVNKAVVETIRAAERAAIAAEARAKRAARKAA